MQMISTRVATSNRVRVWDIGVRLFHWSLVTMFAATWFLTDPRSLHRNLGYVVIGLISFRLVWGLIGSKHARFADFVPSLGQLFRFVRDVFLGRETRYLGHNPLGAVMILALLTTLGGICGTGYMMGMDAFFGAEWVEDTHKALVNLALVLIAGHLSGVIFTSLRHRENLVKAMITGEKERDL
ncbi:cytochrome b/b6 domain-containing protein [Rhodobacter ferrooxidans]|uniref:Cytochrome B561 n=1 Tax=Rhodobacter ferrooxidans TaxID=371731 RepID=C8S261_9RHOB|nr:cytochrome b/b6 domain-containing protein [Rhodobacter sp. SW2]EEW24933.1 cytochrome B561 [Rhodobacter sp. SW2]